MNPAARTETREFDLVVFGATGFVGRLVCEYLAEYAPASGEAIRWAMAGRSVERLQPVRQGLPQARDVPIILADASDDESLRQLCARTRVVVSTVGPYAVHGEPVVRVCADTGTHYCDLSGEVHWIHRMIERHERRAQQTGARLVPCSGFDSIPSDLGVLFICQELRKRFDAPPVRIHMRVEAARGGVSGGTVASLFHVVQEARDPRIRRALADPYLLCPSDHGFTARQDEHHTPFHDEETGRWAAPFVMAGVNTRVVHRSNALAHRIADLRYDEALLTGAGLRGRLRAWIVSLALGLFALGVYLRPTRWLVKWLLPSPGEGPSRIRRETGFFVLLFVAHTASGQTLAARLRGSRDPGYGATARMLAQAALCLARDVPQDAPGGFSTPASLLGNRLIERLERHAGIHIETVARP